MKKVLVTGAAGFIGAETVRHLLNKGVDVVGIDNLNDYYDVRLKNHRVETLRRDFDFHFEALDIEDVNGLTKLFEAHRFDAIFNLAARAGVRYSMENPTVYFTTNTIGTLNLLTLMNKFSVPKIVLASTSSLYAGEPLPFSEDSPVNKPISPYAASKKAAEQICYTYHSHFGIDCTITRYFTVYGPAGRPDMAPFRFLYWIDHGMPVELFGDGEQTRDFTFVEDIARGTVLASGLKGYEIINLGGGKIPISINRMIRLMESGLGKKAKISYKPAQKADMLETQADIRKAGRLLPWAPETDFEAGIEKMIQWYLQNKSWIDHLKV